MPIIRKVSPQEATAWQASQIQKTRSATAAPDRETLETLLAGLADRSGISRIDHKATHGWLARVYPPGQGGTTKSKSFSDGVYGSPAAALQAAVAWRDAERTAFPPRNEPPYRIWWIKPYRGRTGAFRVRRADGVQRYFSAAANGGEDDARRAAEHWGKNQAPRTSKATLKQQRANTNRR